MDPLDFFIARMNSLMGKNLPESQVLPACGKALKELLASEGWLEERYRQPSAQRYCQHRLHVDPEERFSIVSFVWGPGQETPVHDHTVWGVIGVLEGAEESTAYTRDGDGHLVKGKTSILREGEIECVSPAIGDIHKVRNAMADQVTTSIHVYGADIGKVERHSFDPETGAAKTFVSGYSN